MLFISECLWHTLSEADRQDWEPWFTKYYANGELIDDTDTTSYINKKINKGVVITHVPGSNSIFDTYNSQFGDEESGITDILNIYCGFKAPNGDIHPSISDLFKTVFDSWVSDE